MRMSILRAGSISILFPFVLSSLFACGSKIKIKHQPVKFSEAPSPHGEDRFPNWQYSPKELEGELYQTIQAGKFEVKETRGTAHGTSGAEKVELYLPTYGKYIKLKFKKAIPGDLDSFNNSPRREIAAYRIQKLFLEPEDYVVPTSFLYCVPLNLWHKYHPEFTMASVAGTNCVLGFVSVWLVEVKIPEVLFDESRFLNEPNYAYFMSNLNLLTYLIAHRDARKGNFLVSKDDKRRQVFSIDNGESFGSFPYNFFVQNWDEIIVPALRQDSIERLRQMQRQDLDFLGVAVQLEKDENGILKPVPAGDNLGPMKSVRIHDDIVQLGLRTSEIEDVWERIQTLIADVDSGKIPVF